MLINAIKTWPHSNMAQFVKRLSMLRALAPLGARGYSYKAPQRDINFVLLEVLNAPKHYEKIDKPDCNEDLIKSVIESCSTFSEEKLAPLNAIGDEQGCKLKDGNVSTPKGFKAAYDEYIAGGWQGITVPTEYGGQGLFSLLALQSSVCISLILRQTDADFVGMPLSLGLIKSELIGAANWSWGMYPGLSIGAINTLLLHASEEQKKSISKPAYLIPRRVRDKTGGGHVVRNNVLDRASLRNRSCPGEYVSHKD